MTIAFRSVATLAGAASGSVAAPTPAGTATDDIILIWTLQRHSSSSASNSCSLSGGSASIFTQVLGYNTGITGAGQHQFAVWVGRRGASYTAPTVDYTTGGLCNLVNSIAFSDDNPQGGTFWESLTQNGPSTTSPYGATSYSTTAADRMALQFGVIADNNAIGAITGGTPATTWAGDLQQSSAGTDGSLCVEYEPVPGAGSVVGPTRTVSASDEWHSFGFAIFGASGAQTITGALVTDADTFYGATIAPGAVTVTGALVTDGDTFYGATVSPGAVGITGALVTEADTFYAATVSQDSDEQTITGALFANDNTFFGATIEAARTDRGGDGFPGRSPSERKERRARYVRNRHFVIKRPEPEQPKPGEEPRKVTKAIVREAVAQLPGWWGTLAQARQAVPQTIPVMVMPEVRQPSAEYEQLVAATRAYIEQAIRAYEAAEQDEEDDIELLLMAA